MKKFSDQKEFVGLMVYCGMLILSFVVSSLYRFVDFSKEVTAVLGVTSLVLNIATISFFTYTIIYYYHHYRFDNNEKV